MITKRLLLALAIAVLFLAAAAALKSAPALDLVGRDGATRTLQVLIGLTLAVYSNFMPKAIVRSQTSPLATSRAQSALRVGGWSLTLAGLGYAALWAVAPITVARPAAMVIVATATIVTLAYAHWAALSCRRRESVSS